MQVHPWYYSANLTLIMQPHPWLITALLNSVRLHPHYPYYLNITSTMHVYKAYEVQWCQYNFTLPDRKLRYNTGWLHYKCCDTEQACIDSITAHREGGAYTSWWMAKMDGEKNYNRMITRWRYRKR